MPLAFVGIAALFAGTQLASWQKSLGAREETRKIATNMVASIELVSRMTRDVDTERFLVDEHILESRASAQLRVEAQVAQADIDFAIAAAKYEPLATLPGENLVWQRVKSGVAALEEPRAAALALSRENRDVEARAAMMALDERFSAIGRDASDLIHLNRRGVDRSLTVIEALHRSTASLLVTLGLLGVLATLLVGGWTTRLVLGHEEQLTRYSSLLEGQNRELDAFAGRVAHDLRGPLGSVSLAASILSRRGAGDSNPVMDRLVRGIARMQALIDDLLTLSRVGQELPDASCDPRESAAALREDFLTQHQSDGAELRVEVEPARVRGKAELLRQVLWNLTENGVKYRRPETRAEVAIVGRVESAGYELRVSDNGTGMDPEDVRRVFEPFHRADRTRDRPGTGLGMSIVKRIVDASGGSIRVESQLGRGTVVVITLPLARASA
ncbi:MAG: Phytochrome, two-component sensor histidine kinase [Myxococcales bacterium]|nr:Phytochrome, two-component sensor histidine kinase [Myxococcales bacterium]